MIIWIKIKIYHCIASDLYTWVNPFSSLISSSFSLLRFIAKFMHRLWIAFVSRSIKFKSPILSENVEKNSSKSLYSDVFCDWNCGCIFSSSGLDGINSSEYKLLFEFWLGSKQSSLPSSFGNEKKIWLFFTYIYSESVIVFNLKWSRTKLAATWHLLFGPLLVRSFAAPLLFWLLIVSDFCSLK